MKLVGASNWFVRGSFMLEGLLCLAETLAVILLLLARLAAGDHGRDRARTTSGWASRSWR
jgi:cell division protein FtsX